MDDLDKGENYTVRNMGLAESGALLVDWAVLECPFWPNSRKKPSNPSHSLACVLPVAFT